MYMDTRKTKRVTQESTEMETFVPESSIKVFFFDGKYEKLECLSFVQVYLICVDKKDIFN